MTATLRHQIGDLIQERYEVLGVLGAGAFGTVYQCRDRELNTLVAIKELHVLDDASNAGEREAALVKFRQEAVNLSNLRHPHIVSGHYQPHSGTWLVCPVDGLPFKGAPVCPVHGAPPIVIKQRNYLVMEYLSGPDLAQAAQKAGGTLSSADAIRLLSPIADALSLIHSRGLVHRDIKSENIRLRTANDDAVLLDFGITTQSGEEGGFSTRAVRHTTGGGTLGYAPESSQERRFPDARSDIHALGMTLYSLLTGLDPLEDSDLEKMRLQPPRFWNQNISLAMEALILRAISANPAQRPQSAREFGEELRRADGNTFVAHDAMAETSASPQSSTRSGTTTAIAPPFTFRSGAQARDVGELAALMDRERVEAKDYLYRGDFATWLSQIGRADLAQRAREIIEEYPDQHWQGLEALAQATGLAAPPQMLVQPSLLDFGVVQSGKRATLPLQLTNNGRGHLFGMLHSGARGLVFPEGFDGNNQTILVTFDSRNLERIRHTGEIVIDSSAGEWRVPFVAQVAGREKTSNNGEDATVAVALWGILGMLCGFILRALPLSHQVNGQKWLNGSSQVAWLPAAPLFGLAMSGVMFALLVGEATRRRSWWVFFGALVPAFLFSLLCAVAGNLLLVAGDRVLEPLASPLVGQWAAGGWLVVGGVLGAIYGTVRCARDIFSHRLLNIMGGWGFFLFTLIGIVWLVRSMLEKVA